MANELLDFVMSLVRDPDVAARYAADPAQTLADAHLTGVTSADVSSLLPLVSDSLSTAAPAAGDASVWTSGAATAAFDAFGAHSPVPMIDASAPVIDTSHAVAVDPAGATTFLDNAVAIGQQPAYDEFNDVSGAQLGTESAAGDDPGWVDDWHHVATDSGTHNPLDHGHTGF